jgi:hypothetical protein
MLCVVTVSVEVVHCAVRLLPEPAREMAEHPVTELPPSLKLTVPVGLVPTTVAVNVTDAPCVEGFRLLASVVVVATGPPPAAEATAAAALRMPAPHSAVVQLQATFPGVAAHAGPGVGNTRAVVWIFDSTCAGVSDALAENMSETTPVTCGAAMLVPAY